jgi:hypothetical protein
MGHSRHTFATNHLREGVDICTVQVWLGHRDIKSTMVYLKGIPTQRCRAQGQQQRTGDAGCVIRSNDEKSRPRGRLFS